MTMEEFKNQVQAAAVELLSGDVKDAIITGIRDVVLPALKEVADPFTAKLKEDAAKEAGWVKFRDGVFIPGVISIAFWVSEKLLDKMAEKETAAIPADTQDAAATTPEQVTTA